MSLSIFYGRSSSIIFGTCAVVLLLLSLLSPKLSASIRAASYAVISPVLSAAAAPVQMVTQNVDGLSRLTRLHAENTRLQAENIRLREWYGRAVALQSENQSLRGLLNVQPDPNYTYTSARILSDSGGSFAKTLMVKAGASDNVKSGQAVLSGQGLIGRIIETARKTARILLVTDMNSRVPVYIEGVNQHAVMAGRNDNTPELAYLPPEIVVKAGQRVMTSGYGGIFPEGLPIGVIIMDPKTAKPRVQLYTDFNALMHVRVVQTTP